MSLGLDKRVNKLETRILDHSKPLLLLKHEDETDAMAFERNGLDINSNRPIVWLSEDDLGI